MLANSENSTRFQIRTPSVGALSQRRHHSSTMLSPRFTYQEMAKSTRDHDEERRRVALEIDQRRETSALQSAHVRLREQESTHERMMTQFKT